MGGRRSPSSVYSLPEIDFFSSLSCCSFFFLSLSIVINRCQSLFIVTNRYLSLSIVIYRYAYLLSSLLDRYSSIGLHGSTSGRCSVVNNMFCL